MLISTLFVKNNAMDAPANMYYFQMLILLLVMAFCTIWIGRMIQWLILRKAVSSSKMWLILVNSLWVSYVLSLIIWLLWPQPAEPMWGIFCIPAVVGEVLVLFLTFVFFKRRKHT